MIKDNRRESQNPLGSKTKFYRTIILLRVSALDDQYQVYINRLMGMIRLEHYQNQWNHIQPSPKFEVAADGTIQPVVFPGYSIITPPGTEDPLNAGFFSQLETMQRQIWDSAQGLADGLAVALPAQTFHLTIADLIWDANYRQQIQNIPDYEVRLQNAIADIFSQQPNTGRPIRLRVLGFIVMTRAIAEFFTLLLGFALLYAVLVVFGELQ